VCLGRKSPTIINLHWDNWPIYSTISNTFFHVGENFSKPPPSAPPGYGPGEKYRHWKNRLFMRNVYVMPILNAMKRASSVGNNYQAQMRVRNWWKKFTNHESNSFSSKSMKHLGKNNSSLNIRFVAKTSDIRIFSQNIRSDVKTSEVATLSVTLWFCLQCSCKKCL